MTIILIGCIAVLAMTVASVRSHRQWKARGFQPSDSVPDDTVTPGRVFVAVFAALMLAAVVLFTVVAVQP
jgi:hypothetical protein